MNRTVRLSVVIAITLGAGPSSLGGTYVVPSDEVLVAKADVIVEGAIVDSRSRFDRNGNIETVYQVLVETSWKGSESPVFEIVEQGGVIGNRWEANSAMPDYEVGRSYLIFASEHGNRYSTTGRALGRFLRDDRHQIFSRQAGSISGWAPDGGIPDLEPREFSEMRRLIIDASTGTTMPPPGPDFQSESNPFDNFAAMALGTSQWSDGSVVDYDVTTETPSVTSRGDDGQDILFIDDPNDDIAGSFGPGGGTLAIAYFGGFNFGDRLLITFADIVVQDGVSSSNLSPSAYRTMITHELGHTLGFRHSDQGRLNTDACVAPLPCSIGGAVMNSSVVARFDGLLQDWDLSALEGNYESLASIDSGYLTHQVSGGNELPWHRDNPVSTWRILGGSAPSCGGPVIEAQPRGRTIRSGSSVRLSVEATSSLGELTYQWFIGATGDVLQPIAGANGASIVVSPGTTTSYWVRVSDECAGGAAADSDTTIVEVTTSPAMRRRGARRS